MRDINFIRLQNFIAQYAPTKQKKNYMLKKLQALETELEQLKQNLESDELALNEADEIIAELKMKIVTLENKEQVVTTTVSN